METPGTGHVVIAPDKFKGSLTAAEVAAAVQAGLVSQRPDLRVVAVPVADGGDGTLEAAVNAGFRRVPVEVSGPTGAPVTAAIAVRDRLAVIELAMASGLVLLESSGLEPLAASSFGTGELIRAALDEGCSSVVIGVGGSACTDGGAGMLQALGARFLDAAGADLPPGGGPLTQLESVDLSGLDPRLVDTSVVVATDVDNPLLGPRGAVYVYGPQKGATPADLELLERGLSRLADLIDPVAADRAGAGAAGGVGYAALAVLGATPRPGIDVVLELVDFATHLSGAVLVITGEGRLDEQTLHGKAPAGVAAAAEGAGVPVVAVCGGRDLDDARLHAAGFVAAYALTDLEPDVQVCISSPRPLLTDIGRRIAREQLPG